MFYFLIDRIKRHERESNPLKTVLQTVTLPSGPRVVVTIPRLVFHYQIQIDPF